MEKRDSHLREIKEQFDASVGRARGVLKQAPAAGISRHSRRAPSPALSRWVDHYWMVGWNLRGCSPYEQQTLPHPNIHLVIEDQVAVVAGVFTGKFSRCLEGEGLAFGIKFKPGAFRPFLKYPVSTLANRTISARQVFGESIDDIESAAGPSLTDDGWVAAANAFLLDRLPPLDEMVGIATELVRRIEQERCITSVDVLAEASGFGKRSIQRIFREYVGASPKWVIRRYRLHELVARCETEEKLDWSRIALELGYFDQAHMINDFGSIVGVTPAQYRKMLSRHQTAQSGGPIRG